MVSTVALNVALDHLATEDAKAEEIAGLWVSYSLGARRYRRARKGGAANATPPEKEGRNS